MGVVRGAVSDGGLRKNRLIVVDKLDFAAHVELVHDAARAGPDLFAAPVRRAVALGAGNGRDLKHIDWPFLHQGNFKLAHLVPDVTVDHLRFLSSLTQLNYENQPC